MCKIDFVVFESSDKKDGKYLKDFLGIKAFENTESFARLKRIARKCASLTCASEDARSNFEFAASVRVEGEGMGTPAVDAKVSTGDERENMGMRSTYANRRYRHRNLQRELERENRVFQAKCHPTCIPLLPAQLWKHKRGGMHHHFFDIFNNLLRPLPQTLGGGKLQYYCIHLRESLNRDFLH